MNAENSKTNEFNKFIYQFTDKRNLKNPNNENIVLVNLSIYYTWQNIKSVHNSNKFKVSAPTWSDEFDILVVMTSKISLSLSSKNAKQFCFFVKNRIDFKVKTGYKLELLSLETMKLLGSTEKDVNKDKDVPKLESVEVVSVHCILVNNCFKKASKVLFTFVPNKQFGLS